MPSSPVWEWGGGRWGHRPYGYAGSHRRDTIYGVRGKLDGDTSSGASRHLPLKGKAAGANFEGFPHYDTVDDPECLPLKGKAW